jgi:iron(III) transport system substrate-binding protein
MQTLIMGTLKRCFPLKRSLLTVSFACAISMAPTAIDAQPAKLPAAERQHLLESQARKEGRVIFYAVSADMDKLMAVFRERHPYIKIDHFRAGGAALTSKILNESRAGKTADVIAMNATPAWVLMDHGLLSPYVSPALDGVRNEFRSAENLWVGFLHYLLVAGYNTELVPKNAAPESYDDLLNKKWTKQIGIDQTDWDWFQMLANVWGESKATHFLSRLMALQPNVRRGHTLQAQLLAAGEFAISSVLYDFRVKQMKRQGAPIEGVLLPPAVAQADMLLLARGAPHPNAAALLMDWLLSKEAQSLIEQDLRRNSVRKDMGKDLEQLVKGEPMHVMSPEKLGPKSKYYVELYRKIVGT